MMFPSDKRVPVAPFLFCHGQPELFDNVNLFAIVNLPTRGAGELAGNGMVPK
jgi:hypothetical protein